MHWLKWICDDSHRKLHNCWPCIELNNTLPRGLAGRAVGFQAATNLSLTLQKAMMYPMMICRQLKMIGSNCNYCFHHNIYQISTTTKNCFSFSYVALGLDQDSLTSAPSVAQAQRQKFKFDIDSASFTLIREDGVHLFDASIDTVNAQLATIENGFQFDFNLKVRKYFLFWKKFWKN